MGVINHRIDLSAFYFDIRKDTLYCDSRDSKKRQSTIILLNVILNSLLKWFAPILSFTTEEIFRLLSKDNKSIHLEKFLDFPENFKNDKLNEKWIELIKLRNVCNISIEEKRASKEIGSSLEASLKINLDKKLNEISSDEMILDIGPKTIKIINNIIDESNTILWNGPAGYFENPSFANGSIKIATKIIDNKNMYDSTYMYSNAVIGYFDQFGNGLT